MLGGFKRACRNREAAGTKKETTYSDITSVTPAAETAVCVHARLAAAVQKLATTGAKSNPNKGNPGAPAQNI